MRENFGSAAGLGRHERLKGLIAGDNCLFKVSNREKSQEEGEFDGEISGRELCAVEVDDCLAGVDEIGEGNRKQLEEHYHYQEDENEEMIEGLCGGLEEGEGGGREQAGGEERMKERRGAEEIALQKACKLLH